MKINVKKVFLYNDDSFINNKIDDKKYELIKYCSLKEMQIWKLDGISLVNMNNIGTSISSLYEKAIELISTYSNYGKNYTSKSTKFDISANYSHRNKLVFDNSIQKQIFINNFVFSKEENFINSLKTCNIKKEDIENLLLLITNKKESSKKDNDYNLEIPDDIINITGLCKYFICNYPTLIINKLFELYYKENELLDKLEKKR